MERQDVICKIYSYIRFLYLAKPEDSILHENKENLRVKDFTNPMDWFPRVYRVCEGMEGRLGQLVVKESQ